MLFSAFKLALGSIAGNAMRSFLTILGVIIGVAAVITMVTLGSGATEQVTSDIEGLGSNLVMIVPGSGMRMGGQAVSKPFKSDDADAIRDQIANVVAVSPSSQKRIVAVYGNQNWATNVTGIVGEYFDVFDWKFSEGRSLTEGEVRSGASSCVIGETVRIELFGALSPIGESIRLGNVSCRVVGLLDAKGQSSFGTDQDDLVLVPLRTFQRRISGNTDVALIAISVSGEALINRVKGDVTYLLRERRRISAGEEDDFSVRDMTEITDMLTSTTTIMTMLLGAVAGVSMLVGGIGIMNIMLVSVTERTREIGIRLAIGARRGDVLLQFLVEAVVLASLGGLIGVILALLVSWLLAGMMGIPFTPDAAIVFLSFFFSAVVGVAFGYFPARRAATLNPIEALRYE
ncbi:MAG: ABC transporter permease [Chromatiales bacterium]|jgi:putative ABC transport system permease protein